MFVNEHLTKKRANLAKFARDLKKQKKIFSTWTRDGKIFIKTNGLPEVAQIYAIRDMEDFKRLRLS